MLKIMRFGLLITVLCGLQITQMNSAYACACCTERGQRSDYYASMDEIRIDLTGLKFDGTAYLYNSYYLDEKFPELELQDQYQLTVLQDDHQIEFKFKSPNNQNGSLILKKPSTFHYSATDSLADDNGSGPYLYKEWQIKSFLYATGIFSSSAGRGQQIKLILQGYGNTCDDNYDLTRWTLEITGPKVNYYLFGDLKP